MKRICFLFILIALLPTLSCKKLLETKPTNFLTTDSYYQTQEQLQSALAGVYDRLGASEVFGDKMIWNYNSSTDESYQKSSSTLSGLNVNVYDPTNSEITNFWRVLYEGIERANMLLDHIHVPQMNEDVRKKIQGETLFLRGYYYFLLVTNFGDVPLKLTSTTSVNNISFPRVASKIVYEQVINDMTTAEALLQDQTITALGFGGRISKTAVQAALARVNLYMAGYPIHDASRYAEALSWATKVVNSGEHTLNPDYKQIFINYAQDKYDTKESIWEIEFFGNGLDNFREPGRIGNNIGITCQDKEIGICYGSLNASEKLYNLYAEADSRRDWNCAPYTFSGTTNAIKVPTENIWARNIGKWRREYETLTPKNSNSTPQNFAVIRYADVLLMLAEAENELNGPAAAYPYVNEVRRRAYGMYLPGGTITDAADLKPEEIADKDALRKAIQAERSRELCFEGLRRYDLIRWGIYLQTMDEFASGIEDNAPATQKYAARAARNLSVRHLLFPIPLRELSVNKVLVQNPYW